MSSARKLLLLRPWVLQKDERAHAAVQTALDRSVESVSRQTVQHVQACGCVQGQV